MTQPTTRVDYNGLALDNKMGESTPGGLSHTGGGGALPTDVIEVLSRRHLLNRGVRVILDVTEARLALSPTTSSTFHLNALHFHYNWNYRYLNVHKLYVDYLYYT